MMVEALEAARSPLRKNAGSLNVYPKNGASPNDGPTRFAAQPLPLGGKYVILAHRQSTYAASKPISLNEGEPIRKITLKLAPGIDLRGQVLDDQGHPILRAEVSLRFQSDYEQSLGAQSQLTDAEGGFRLERVNPDAPGSYTITVRHAPGFQPQSQTVNFRKLPLCLQLEKGKCVEGMVEDQATGRPIPRARITATLQENRNTAARWLDTLTDANGRFKFTDLGPGAYRLQVEGATLETVAPPNNLVIGGQSQPARLRVRLPEGSPLKLAKTP